MLTFDQFIATKTSTTDLGAALSDASLVGCSGYLYCGSLYIEQLATGNGSPDMWNLVIGNKQWHDANLKRLEEYLYDFAKSEGYCDEAGDAIAQRIADKADSETNETMTAQSYADRTDELVETFLNGNRKDVAAAVAGDAILAVMVADNLDTDDRGVLLQLMLGMKGL